MTAAVRTRLFAAGTAPLIAVALIAQGPPAGAPPSFEVASIRPSAQSMVDAVLNGVGVHPMVQVQGRRVQGGPLLLQTLITTAYEIRPDQLDGPPWLASPDAQSFLLEARLPRGATPDDVPAMLRSLLAERFKLRVRTSSKEVDGHALAVGSSGLRLLGTTVPAGPGQVGARVVPMGRAALTIRSDGAMPRNEQGRRDVEALRERSHDRLQAALEHVGLRLDRARVSLPVVVVEHVEKMPTEN